MGREEMGVRMVRLEQPQPPADVDALAETDRAGQCSLCDDHPARSGLPLVLGVRSDPASHFRSEPEAAAVSRSRRFRDTPEMPHDPDSWWLDESAHAGREHFDPAHARRYDAKMDSGAPEEIRMLREAGHLTDESVVVDLGAGSGQFTLAAAPVCRRVIAVDVSPVMLAVLRDKVRASGADNIEIVQAGFLTYEHEGDPADVVYSRFALHHLRRGSPRPWWLTSRCCGSWQPRLRCDPARGTGRTSRSTGQGRTIGTFAWFRRP